MELLNLDHEAGSEGADPTTVGWSTNKDCEVRAANALNGSSFGIWCQTSSRDFVRHDTSGSGTWAKGTIRKVGARFHLNNGDGGDGNELYILHWTCNAASNTTKLIAVEIHQVSHVGGLLKFKARAGYKDDGGTASGGIQNWTAYSADTDGDVEHTVEVELKRTSAGGSDGYVKFWLNQTFVGELTGLADFELDHATLGDWEPDRIFFGRERSTGEGSSWSGPVISLDDFIMRDDTEALFGGGTHSLGTGTSVCTSGASGTLVRKRDIDGSGASTTNASLTGMTRSRSLTAVATATSAVAAATINRLRTLGAAAVASAAALVGTLSRLRELAGSSASTSGATGSFTAQNVKDLGTGTCVCTSGASGSLVRTRGLSGTVVATSTIPALEIDRRRRFSTAVAASTSGAPAASVTRSRGLVGVAGATSGAPAIDAARLRELAGIGASTSGGVGVLASDQLIGIMVCTSGASGTLRRSRRLSGQLLSTTGGASTISRKRGLTGALAGVSVFSGQAARSRSLAGLAQSTSAMYGTFLEVSETFRDGETFFAPPMGRHFVLRN